MSPVRNKRFITGTKQKSLDEEASNGVRLKQLLETLDNYRIYPKLNDFEVRGISCNSKGILNKFIFVAIKGTQQDGHKFIQEAIEHSAGAVIAESSQLRINHNNKVALIEVKDTRIALAKLSAEFYGNPSQKIKVLGITGTNGKTTVSYLIEALLKEAKRKSGVIGTVNYRFANREIPARNTTPGPIELQSLLSRMLQRNIPYAIMEVSSHALDQKRTDAINFYSAVFTNLTQDHLDYHRSLENYFQTKARLFQNMNGDNFVIINADDAYGRRLKKLTNAKIITYAIENTADVTAEHIRFNSFHTEFLLNTTRGRINLSSRLIGRHNVYNILAAVAFGLREGLDLSMIKSAIEKFSLVPGRVEKIDFAGDFSVFVDYAHTEDALKNVINTLRELSKNRIIVVFGCGGERDKTKRPLMGYVVTELADYAIITNDNPRSEDPQEIIVDIKKGIKKKNFCIIPERKEAIKKSLSIAGSGDIVLIAGKGHENYQILKDRLIPFDDREVVRECLKSRTY